ncbi:MAG: class II glutamine amidotransferase [Candidatus Eisenbacteria bacterium]|nr:class II glutamine amidotransferase [Candidatus Eisenbacteria bacterium]
MCRMIAAMGDVDAAALREALREMAANDNPAYVHEKRALGEAYRHEDGWGAAWISGDTIHVRHSVHSLLEDPLAEELDELRTDLLVLHARRASQSHSVRLENTHPFLVEYRGRIWAFCHNGTIQDTQHLRPAPGLIKDGDIDSELLFHHLLHHLDPEDPERSLGEALDRVQQYTALHSLLVSLDGITAVSRRHPEHGLPDYHTLWEAEGDRVRVLSSEPVDALGPLSWQRLPDSAVRFWKREPSSVLAGR